MSACLCLSCECVFVSVWGWRGQCVPWFPAQDEWVLLHHCLGRRQSRLRMGMFQEKKGDRGGAAGGHRTCFLHPWQGSGVIPFCIHLTAASDKVGDPGLIKTSEFWQLQPCSVSVPTADLGSVGFAPRTETRRTNQGTELEGAPWLKEKGLCLCLGSLSLLTASPHMLWGVGGGQTPAPHLVKGSALWMKPWKAVRPELCGLQVLLE